MTLSNPFKLQKLKISAFSAAARGATDAVGEPFEAMFNPSSIEQTFSIGYGRTDATDTTPTTLTYTRTKPGELKLKLLLDGTDVHAMGILRFTDPPTVAERVKAFLDLTWKFNGEIHEPNYLVVSWGELDLGYRDGGFSCRLANAKVTYTSFDTSGAPLRAEIDVTLWSDEETEKRRRADNTSSPDLTHLRTVTSGDTLPLLSKEIYGSSEHYLFVAAHNQLDDFRRLSPGMEIEFPPLPKQGGGS